MQMYEILMTCHFFHRYITKRDTHADGDGSLITGYAACAVTKVFSASMEADFAKHLVSLADKFYGVTVAQCRTMAFEMAMANKLKVPASWTREKKAGYDWYSKFKSRHNLSVRTPEPTSLARATAFNKFTVGEFFTNLQKAYDKHQFRPQCIFNMDETGCTTVQKPRQVISQKGTKQVGKMTSAERGELTTVACTICADGSSIPPLVLFPRVRMQPQFLHGNMPGTKVCAVKGGWMTAEIFANEYLDHLIENTKCTAADPILLILDNHSSHMSIPAISKAKENGIVMLTIPPHTSHKLQPLDISVYGPFKAYYNQAADDWLRNHGGETIRIANIGALVKHACMSALTPRNILSGFEKTGISPINSSTFQESDFVAAEVTDRPAPQSPQPITSGVHSSRPEPIAQESAEKAVESGEECPVSPQPSTSVALKSTGPTTSAVIATPLQRTPLCGTSANDNDHDEYISPSDLFPAPKAGPRKGEGKKRKRGKTLILTHTPTKERLEIEAAQKIRPGKKPAAKKRKRTPSPVSSETEREETPELTDEEEASDEPVLQTRVGDYVLVKVFGKVPNRFKRFVSVVSMVEGDGDVFVTFLKKITSTKYSTTEEEDWVGSNDVIRVLPEPTVGSRFVKFAEDVEAD